MPTIIKQRYPNLKAEMTRRNITLEMLGKKLNRTVGTISLKLNDKYPLTFSEAVQIRDIVAPNMSLDILFSEEAIDH